MALFGWPLPFGRLLLARPAPPCMYLSLSLRAWDCVASARRGLPLGRKIYLYLLISAPPSPQDPCSTPLHAGVCPRRSLLSREEHSITHALPPSPIHLRRPPATRVEAVGQLRPPWPRDAARLAMPAASRCGCAAPLGSISTPLTGAPPSSIQVSLPSEPHATAEMIRATRREDAQVLSSSIVPASSM
jgi:hypothetical protein